MIMSIFFAFSFLGGCFAVFLSKKAERQLNGFAWINITFVIMLGYHALVAGILSVIEIKVNLFSIGIFDLALCLIFLLLYSKKVVKIQKYYFEVGDACIILVLLAAVVIRFIMQFGTTLNLHYITSDPSVHLFQAMGVINSGKVENMYFGSLTNALFMEFMSPLFSGFYMYKCFILMDGIMLFVSGLSFFSVMKQQRNENGYKIIIPEIILLLMYVFGYPLNNMVFGFVYLGMAVSIVATIIVVTNVYLQKEAIDVYCQLALVVLCIAISVSYVLFAPVIYISVFICVSYKFLKERNVKVWIISCLKIFLLPCILTILYCFLGMFSGNVTSMRDGIQSNGYVYQDIFMNVWIIILPLMVGLFSSFKKRRISLESVGICMMILFIFSLGVATLVGVISPYYFFKLAYVMSLFLYAFAHQGILCWFEESSKTLLAFCVGIILIFGVFLGKLEERIAEVIPNFISYKKVAFYLDIYEFNNQAMNSDIYSSGKMQLYQKIYEEYRGSSICIGEWLDCYWYEALTNTEMNQEKYYPWLIDQEQYWENISQDRSIACLLVLKNSEIYEENSYRFKGLDIKYENEEGIIYSIDDAGRRQLVYGDENEGK